MGVNIELAIILFAVAFYGQVENVLVDPTQGTSVQTATTECKIQVFCQIRLVKTSSSVTVGGTSICQPGSAKTSQITVAAGSSVAITKSVASGDYFRAIIKGVPNSCTGITTTTNQTTTTGKCQADTGPLTGISQSPGYPRFYDNNQYCEYKFAAKPGYCGVSLQVLTFSLEKSPSCSADYLKMGNKSYCGDDLVGKKVSYMLPFTMVFKSDAVNTGKGFAMAYTYIQNCDSVCNKKFTNLGGYILPPLDSTTGQYISDAYCKYEIQPKPGAVCVKYTILKTDMADEGDYIKIDGTKYSSKLAPPTADGTPVFSRFPDDGTPAEMDFISDKSGATSAGFTIIYQQIMNAHDCPQRSCQPPFSQLSGFLKSPKSPNNYPKNYDCEYVINAFNGSASALLGLQSELASGDSLEVTEGAPTGPLTFGQLSTVTFNDTSHKIRLRFRSDSVEETKFTVLVAQTQTTTKTKVTTKPKVTTPTTTPKKGGGSNDEPLPTASGGTEEWERLYK